MTGNTPPSAEPTSFRLTGAAAQQQEQVIPRHRHTAYDALTNTVTLMSSLDSPHSVSVPAELRQTFRALADEWLSETAHLSDPVDKFMHPALVQIIGLGKQSVPMILQEVRKMSGHWFYALEHINRTNPVSPEDQWDVEKTAAAWLEWGRREGLIL